jgi:hypothetical protein
MMTGIAIIFAVVFLTWLGDMLWITFNPEG